MMNKIITTLVIIVAILWSSGAFALDAELGMSPGNAGRDGQAIILDAISSARSSLHVAVYQFTSKPIVAALIAAKDRGLDVRVVVDEKYLSEKDTESKYGIIQTLVANGVGVRIDGRYPVMHHKFIVIDGTGVETGSLNFTKRGNELDANNVLWIRNEPGLAAQYDSEWQRLWNESVAFKQ